MTLPTDDSIACIILNWNGAPRIEACVRALKHSVSVQVRIVVVDNGSTDGSPDVIRGSHPDARIILQPVNTGVAGARNVGVRSALDEGYRYILLINDDAVVGQETLSRLKEQIDSRSGCGIVTPRILDNRRPGRIWYDGGAVNMWGDPVHRKMGAMDDAEDKAQEIPFASGCCVLIASEVFRRIGFLDESFFAYSEDADFSFRALRAGIRIVHVPTARVRHDQSLATTENRGKWFRDYYVTRNKLLLFRKHYVGVRRIVACGYSSIRWFLLPLAYHAVTLEFARCRGVFRGGMDHLIRRYGGTYT